MVFEAGWICSTHARTCLYLNAVLIVRHHSSVHPTRMPIQSHNSNETGVYPPTALSISILEHPASVSLHS